MPKPAVAILMSFGVVMASLRGLSASDPVLPSSWPKIDEETTRLVRDLGARDFQVRDRASKELKQRGLAAFPMLRLAVAAANDAEVSARTDQALATPDPDPPSSLARLAIVAGDFAGAEQILREALAVNGNGGAEYAALRAMRAGANFDPAVELKELRKLPIPENTINEVGMYLYRAAGDLQRAAECAARFDTSKKRWLKDSKATIFIEASDFKALAALSQEDIRKPSGANDPQGLPHLLALRLSGRGDEADRMMSDFLAHHPATGSIYSMWIHILLQNDRAEECIKFLQAHEENRIASCLLLYQLRFREALALRLESPHATAHFLVVMGFRQQAQKVLLDNKPELQKYPDYASQTAFTFAHELEFAGLTKEAQAYATLGWQSPNKSSGKPDPYTSHDEYSDYAFWLGRHPESADQAAFEKVRKIIAGEVKPTLEEGFAEKQLASMSNLTLESRRGQLWDAYKALIRAGCFLPATQLVKLWIARENDLTPLGWLGNLALNQNDPRAAADYYLQAARANVTDAHLMYKAGMALSKLDGSREEGQKLMAFSVVLSLGTLSNDADQAMLPHQSAQETTRWIDDYHGRFGEPSRTDINGRLARAQQQAEKKGDFAGALKLQTQALFRPTRLVQSEYADILANVVLYHRLRALGALQRNDMATLKDALDKNLTDGPPDIDLLEKTLPALRTADPAAAQKILTRALDRLIPIVQDYPEATQYKTQLTRLQALQ